MTITVALPEDLHRRLDPVREAHEAFATEGYRTAALTTRAADVAGVRDAVELDGFLKAH